MDTLTSQEIGRLNICPGGTLRRLIHEGRIVPAVRGGRHEAHRFTLVQALALLAARAARQAGASAESAGTVLAVLARMTLEQLEHDLSRGAHCILVFGDVACPHPSPPFMSLSDMGVQVDRATAVDLLLRLRPVAVDLRVLWERITQAAAQLRAASPSASPAVEEAP
jgi:hypothetical protein